MWSNTEETYGSSTVDDDLWVAVSDRLEWGVLVPRATATELHGKKAKAKLPFICELANAAQIFLYHCTENQKNVY
jgi:hypothetical protein